MAEVERYTQLNSEKELLNERWDEQNSLLVESHERVIAELTDDYEAKLAGKEQEIAVSASSLVERVTLSISTIPVSLVFCSKRNGCEMNLAAIDVDCGKPWRGVAASRACAACSTASSLLCLPPKPYTDYDTQNPNIYQTLTNPSA